MHLAGVDGDCCNLRMRPDHKIKLQRRPDISLRCLHCYFAGKLACTNCGALASRLLESCMLPRLIAQAILYLHGLALFHLVSPTVTHTSNLTPIFTRMRSVLAAAAAAASVTPAAGRHKAGRQRPDAVAQHLLAPLLARLALLHGQFAAVDLVELGLVLKASLQTINQQPKYLSQLHHYLFAFEWRFYTTWPRRPDEPAKTKKA